MNNFITLTENEIVNYELMDNEHKELVSLVNEIFSKIGKLDRDENLTYIKKLVDHIRKHFDSEENCMKEFKYYGYISHKLEHDRFYNKLLSFSVKVEEEKTGITLDLLQSIKTWFFNHLEMNDKKCAKHFIESLASETN